MMKRLSNVCSGTKDTKNGIKTWGRIDTNFQRWIGPSPTTRELNQAMEDLSLEILAHYQYALLMTLPDPEGSQD